jgi:hypothetical protein
MSLLLRYRLRLYITPGTSCRPSLTATTSQQHVRAYASKKTKHKQQRQRNNDDDDNTDAAEQQQQRPVASGHATFPGSKRAPIATTSLRPGSQQVVTDPAAQEELVRAEAKMVASVEWFRREVAQLEARASGRVTPRLLDPVRVVLPDGSPRREKGEDARVRLEELATVGVRDGSSLVVTVFDSQVSFVPPLLYQLPPTHTHSVLVYS